MGSLIVGPSHPQKVLRGTIRLAVFPQLDLDRAIIIIMKKSKKQQKRGKPKPKKQAKRVSVPRPRFALSTCAQRYLLACTDPFHPDAQGACVPSSPARSSQKASAFLRFSVTAGAGYNAYILVTPAISSDSAFGWCTTSVYSSTLPTFSPVINGFNSTSTTGVVPFLMSNLPYTRAQTAATTSDEGTVQGRIVSVGIRVTYTGTALNEGGLITMYCDPDHDNLWGEGDATLSTRRDVRVERFKREKKYECSLFAISPEETVYNSTRLGGAENHHANIMINYPFSSTNYISPAAATGNFQNGAGPCLIAISPPGTTSAQAYVEVICHCEYLGVPTQARATPSTTDTVGLDVVQNALSKGGELANTQGMTLRSGVNAVLGAASDVSGHITRNFGYGLAQGAMDRMTPGMTPMRQQRIQYRQNLRLTNGI